MKKLMIAVLAVCLLLSLAACGASTAPDSAGNNPVNQDTTPSVPSDDNFSFTYKDVEIALHAPAAPIVTALGEPTKYTESTSCAFDGLDKSYYYGSFYLETYPLNNQDFVSGWWFADDTITTEEGIYIGSSQADVEKAYGTEGYNGSNAFVISKATGTLTIIVEEGFVSSIQYAIKVD